MLAHAEFVNIVARESVVEPDKAISFVDFPESGMHSMTACSDDDEVEVATIGFEGMTGLPLILGETTSTSRVFCQIPGTAWRIAASDFFRLISQSDTLSRLCHRYVLFVIEQASQNSACNRIHSIEERCAKWLCLSHDRADGDKFELTQDFLAGMLGVRRQSVNLAAGALHQAGLIAYSRGNISISNRPGLEDVACRCYSKIRKAFEKFMS